MRVYKARINDYGHGDYQTAIVSAPSKERAVKELRMNGHRVDPDAIHEVGYKPKGTRIIDIF